MVWFARCPLMAGNDILFPLLMAARRSILTTIVGGDFVRALTITPETFP